MASEPTIVLDLSRTTYIDSTVLTLLVAQRDEMLKRQTWLVIIGASKMGKKIFDRTSLSKLFDMRPNLVDVQAATATARRACGRRGVRRRRASVFRWSDFVTFCHGRVGKGRFRREQDGK